MIRVLRTVAAAAFLLFSATIAQAGSFQFTLATLPSDGAIFAGPGDPVGWGYDIANLDADNYLVLTNLMAGTLANGIPDGLIFDFPILAPGQQRVVPYDPIGYWGLYRFTWDTPVADGAMNAGTFVLQGEWYAPGDMVFIEGVPAYVNADGLAVGRGEASAEYSVTAAQPVPEPGTVGLLGFGVATLFARRSMRKKSR